jgi:hypothetical protein
MITVTGNYTYPEQTPFLSSLRQAYCPRLMPPCRGSYGACVRTPTWLDRVCPFLFNLF